MNSRATTPTTPVAFDEIREGDLIAWIEGHRVVDQVLIVNRADSSDLPPGVIRYQAILSGGHESTRIYDVSDNGHLFRADRRYDYTVEDL